MKKAPESLQKSADSTEDLILNLINESFQNYSFNDRNLSIKKGYLDSKLNAEYGDILISEGDNFAPLVTIEVKYSTHYGSFSISKEEKHLTKSSFIVINGPEGIWCVRTKDALGHYGFLTEHFGDKPYYVCKPPFDIHISWNQMCHEIKQKLCIND